MKVLVADDDRAIQARLKSYLHKWGHEVAVCGDGNEAWRLFQEGEHFDFVISDWQMPGMDGPEFIRKIRALNRTKYVYTILLTSKTDMDDVVDGMEAGADDFIRKPFKANELRVRIRAGERILGLEHNLAKQNDLLVTANTKISQANERMKKELQAAADIQKTFLPDSTLEIPGIRTAWKYQPCDELGGDSLSIRKLDEDHYAFCVLDVSGHGVSASLLSVSLCQSLSRESGRGCVVKKGDPPIATPPAEVLTYLNTLYQWNPQRSQYFTILYGLLNIRSSQFTFVSAGHPGPILLCGNGDRILPSTPPAVGFLEETNFIETQIQLAPGDRVFIYSDGVSETLSPEEEELGEQGLLQILQSSRELDLPQAIERVQEELDSWRGHTKVADDVSLLAFEAL